MPAGAALDLQLSRQVNKPTEKVNWVSGFFLDFQWTSLLSTGLLRVHAIS